MGRLFGTDGVRGVAGIDLTAQLAMDLAVAAVPVLVSAAARSDDAVRPVAVIGRDSRASGDFLEAAVVAGLASSGVDVLRLGVIPTPGVAHLTRALNADFGVVLSASHNPAADNGIKFFGRGGVKLADEAEDEIEAALHAVRSGRARPDTGQAAAGRVRPGDRRLLRQRDLPRSPARDPCRRRRRAIRRCRGCGWSWTARTAPPTASGRARCAGPAPRSSRSARLPTATTSTPGSAPLTWRRWRRRSSSTAPTRASRSTVTPTGAWRWTATASRWTETRSSPCWPRTSSGPASWPATPWWSP